MKRLIITGLAIAASLTAAAPAHADTTVAECWGASTGEWDYDYRVKPRNCTFNGDEAHAYQTPLHTIYWRSWGEQQACGKGTYFYNMGFRSRVSICLYRPRDGVFTRIRGRFSRHSSYLDSNGNRVYVTGKATTFRTRAV